MFINFVCYFLIIVVSTRVVCEPICKSNCKNGYCEKHEVCACNAGYTKRNNTCVPVCEGGCLHGICIYPNSCLCFSGYNYVNGKCQTKCRYPCGNGTCMYSGLCVCFHGFQINYLRQFGHEVGPVCEPICKNCSGINCVGCAKNNFVPTSDKDTTTTKNINNKNSFITSTYNNDKYHTEDTTTTTKDPLTTMTTYNNYKYHTEDTTTTTKDPFITMSTHDNYKYHTEDTTKITKDKLKTITTQNNYKYHTEETTTSTITTPYFVSSSSSAETVLDNNANNNITSVDRIHKSWMQQHGMYIWIPILLILATALILLLVWKGAPMVNINLYKGVKNRRSYNVQGAFRTQNASSGPFERACLEIIPYEREAQS